MKTFYTFILLILSVFTFGRELFVNEKKFYDQKLEDRKVYLLKEFRLNHFNTQNLKTLKESIKIAEKEENDLYINNFYNLLIEQYLHEENFKAIIDLYDQSLKNPKDDDLLSYIKLQSKFYNIFYQNSIDNECINIVNNLKKLIPQLSGYEKVFAYTIINDIDGLKIKGNTIDVKQQRVQESIQAIEILSKFFEKDELEIGLSQRYNHLAITYLEDINRIDHAILLFKKAIRYNNNRDLKHNTVLFTNIAYAYNLKGDFKNSLNYLEKALPFIEDTNDRYQLGYRTYCNLADSYNLANDTINQKKYEKICFESADKFKLRKEEIENEIVTYFGSNERKIKKSLIGDYLVPITALCSIGLVITSFLFIRFFRNKVKIAL